MNNVFITGGTGFLGSILINEILSSSDAIVYVLVRGENIEKAQCRMISVLKEAIQPEALDEWKIERIKVCVGDITKKNLGLDMKTLEYLGAKVDTIYNLAAITGLNLPLEKVREINVGGTKNVLEFAMICKNNLKKINHIGTAYVAGTYEGIFKEDYLDKGQTFNNTYEQGKFESELLIRKYRDKGLDIDVFRPGIIVGRYSDGKTTNFKMFYQPINFFSQEIFGVIPADKDSSANMINVDVTAKIITKISIAETNRNITYNVVSPTVLSFEEVVGIASEYFGFKRPKLCSLDSFDIKKEYSPVNRLITEPFIPYFNYKCEFSIENTIGVLKDGINSFPKFDKKNLIRLFEYCDKQGFIKRKKKNVVVK
ncbi:MAG: SDR family oxidoreductase [Candidatus Omnitrophica bacterium]|nr:SDR family oxidoreductase [Candidatus Omnitrophota bacterium]